MIEDARDVNSSKCLEKHLMHHPTSCRGRNSSARASSAHVLVGDLAVSCRARGGAPPSCTIHVGVNRVHRIAGRAQ
jgi:hypothetical protein